MFFVNFVGIASFVILVRGSEGPAATQQLSSVLDEFAPNLRVLSSTTLVLGLAAMLPCIIQARRAVRIDAAVALMDR